MPSTDVYYLITLKEVPKQFRASVSWIAVIWYHTQGRTWIRLSADRYSAWTRQKTTLFSGHYLRNRSPLDIGVWVISVYFNIRNTLPKYGTFLLGHPVYIKYNLKIRYDMIYLLTAIRLTPFDSSTVHIYALTKPRTTQWDRIPRKEHKKQ